MKSYTGRSTQPRREPIVYRCACGERFAAEVWRAIGADDSVLRTRLIEGDLNRVTCPKCQLASDVQVTVLFHDAAQQRLVYVAPPSERHRELHLRAELFALLAADAAPPTAYVLAADVVFGAAGLSELVASSGVKTVEVLPRMATPPSPTLRDVPPPDIAPIDTNEAVTTLHAALDAKPRDLDAVLAAAYAQRESSDAIPKQVEAEVTTPRVIVNVPDPRTAVIERWIAARESSTALFVDDRVVVCAVLPAPTLEQFVSHDGRTKVALRPQLHRMSSFPLVALTFVAGEGVERPDESRVLHVPLDLSRAAHRVALDQLGRRCSIELELFDTEYLPVVSLGVVQPLEESVRYLVAEAKAALDRVPVTSRDFEAARTAFFGTNYDRLGRTAIDLPNLDDLPRATPAQARAALQSVSRWSEPAAESYLLEIRGFSLAVWRRLAAAVVRRAVEIGLFVTRGLAERVVRRADDGLDLPPWPELIELQIRRFAELSARLRPSDLIAPDEAANWDLLLREAETAGVVVEDAIVRLADAAFSRVGGRPSRRTRPTNLRSPPAVVSSAPPPAGPATSVDLPQLEQAPPPVASAPREKPAPIVEDITLRPTDALLPLLDDRERRLLAANTIASRRELATLPALIGTLRRMTRTEANALLPRLVAFGQPVERYLIDGLRSKKAFMRQGCALALGRLATPLAIDALVRLLFDEPTEIWTEIARAIGDVGAPAVMPLAARLREVEGDARERIVQALAHVTARDTSGSRAAVEALANGRDALVANAARRALALAPEVLSAHQAIRAGRREQTLVRGFTWRFYDSLSDDSDGEAIGELDSEDLEALEAEEALAPDEEEDPDGIELEMSDLEPKSSPNVLGSSPSA